MKKIFQIKLNFILIFHKQVMKLLKIIVLYNFLMLDLLKWIQIKDQIIELENLEKFL